MLDLPQRRVLNADMAPYRSLNTAPKSPAADVLQRRIRRLVEEVMIHPHPLKVHSRALLGFHRCIYSGDAKAGTLREGGYPAAYELVDETGTTRTFDGAGGSLRTKHRKLARALKNFEKEVSRLPTRGEINEETVRPAARLYAALLRIQPFPYGNDSIAILALCRAYKWLELPVRPPSPDDTQFDAGRDMALLADEGDGLELLTERLVFWLHESAGSDGVTAAHV